MTTSRDKAAGFEIEHIGPGVVNEAKLLIAEYGKTMGLRTLDALHLGAYRLVSESDWQFITADQRLADIAAATGASVVTPQ